MRREGKSRLLFVRDYDAQDLLNQLRDKQTKGGAISEPFFRIGLQLSQRLIAAAVGAFGGPIRSDFTTPLAPMSGNRLLNPMHCVYVRRAGGVFAHAFAIRHPNSDCWCIDLHRNEQTFKPIEGDRHKLPGQFSSDRDIFLCDPMIATGGTACWSIARLKKLGAKHIVFVCWLAARQGLKRMQSEHPDVPIVLVARDPRLTANGYIDPGLGDASDRLFGEQNDEFGNLLNPEEEETRVRRGSPPVVAVPHSGTSIQEQGQGGRGNNG